MCKIISKQFHLLNVFPYLSALFFFIFFIILGLSLGKSITELFAFNESLYGAPQVIFLSGLQFSRAIVFLILLIEIGMMYWKVIKERTQKEKIKNLLSSLFLRVWCLGKSVLVNFALIGINLFFASLIFPLVNEAGRDRLIDNALMHIDKLITGGYPFIIIGNLNLPDFFISLTAISYLQIGSALFLFTFITLVHKREVYKKFITAFLFSFILLMGGWLIMPALTPLDRYIENGYQLPISQNISDALATYAPHEKVVETWGKWLSPHQNGEQAIPVTSIPSAHIVWIIILGTYLYQFRKALFWIFLPFLFLSTLGTLLFTMHYFVDVLAGIGIGVISIYFVSYISQKRKGKSS